MRPVYSISFTTFQPPAVRINTKAKGFSFEKLTLAFYQYLVFAYVIRTISHSLKAFSSTVLQGAGMIGD